MIVSASSSRRTYRLKCSQIATARTRTRSPQSSPRTCQHSVSQVQQTDHHIRSRLCRMYTQLTARGTSIIVSPSNSGVFRGSRSANYSNLVPPLPSIIWSLYAARFALPRPSAHITDPHLQRDLRPPHAGPRPRPRDGRPLLSWWLLARPSSALLASTRHPQLPLRARGRPLQPSRTRVPRRRRLRGRRRREDVAHGRRGRNVHGGHRSADNRLSSEGRRPLGSLNPFLYFAEGAAACVNTTAGSNTGCRTRGFSAKAGWDPVRFYLHDAPPICEAPRCCGCVNVL